MEEDIKKIEYFLNQTDEYYDGNIDIKDCVITKEVAEAIENLINRNKELEVLFSNTFKNNVAYLEKKYVEENYIQKSKVIEKLEERFGILCSELGSYERDNATPEQERIAGGINELRKLKKELLEERN